MVQPPSNNEQLDHDPKADLVSSSVTDITSNSIHYLNHPPAHNESLFQNDSVNFETNEQATYWSGKTSLNKHWKVYVGDARSVLSLLPDNTFQCVITSPPYYWLRDYGVEGQIGKEWKIDEYVQAIANVMDQVKRVLAPDGILFLNLGDTYYSGKGESQGVDKKSSKRRFGLRAVDASGLGVPQKSLIGIPWRVALAMIDRNWVLRSSIIWDRLNPLPESVRDRPGRTYENMFMFVKSKKYYFNQQALNGQREDLWSIEARPKPTPGISTAAFPEELVQKCINVGCPEDGSILDPFAGSGTTLRVALRCRRDATGIDINRDFCEYIVKDLTWL